MVQFSIGPTRQPDPDSRYELCDEKPLTQQLYKDKNAITYDLHPRLGRIECPTLILGSTYDTSVPESNEQIHKKIKGSTLVVLDSCGHFPYIEAPEKFFGEVERFLAKAHR